MSPDTHPSRTTAHRLLGPQSGETATDSTSPSSTSPPDITLQVRDVSARPIAYGGYADIYDGMWENGAVKIKVAIKVLRIRAVDPAGKLLLRQLGHELSVWQRLSHPNIHVLCGLYDGIGPASAMVSPWYANGDINTYIGQRAADPDIETLKFDLVDDVLTGLSFLHGHSVVHGDIKGGNVLVDDDGTARLCDFGLSRLLANHSQSITNTTSVKGTFRWMAPEILLNGGPHTYKSDMWAVGCLLLEVWAGLPPYFRADSDQEVFLAVWRKEVPHSPRPVDVNVIAWTQVETCCSFDTTTRPDPGHLVETLRALRQIIPRVTSIIIHGGPFHSELIAAFAAMLSAGDPSLIAKLNALQDSDLALELVSMFSVWSLDMPPASRLYNDMLSRWCLDTVAQCEALSDEAADYAEDNEYGDRIDPSKLRPFSKLLAAVDTAYADAVFLRFSRASVGTPIRFEEEEYPWSVAWFPDDDRIAVGLLNGTVDILSTSSGAALRHLRAHKASVKQVALSSDGRHLVSCSEDHSVRLWDAETGNAVGEPMLEHISDVLSVAFSPDGTHIASGSSDETMRIWSCETGACVLGPLCGHTSSVSSVAYSLDGSRIISGSLDKTIRVWDAQTGTCILGPLSGHASRINSVAFSPDGLRFVSGSNDRTIRIWDAFSGELIGVPMEGHSDAVECVSYSPDGARIASGSSDCTIRIWDAATGALYHHPLRGYMETVWSVAFSPDGRKLASASQDGSVHVWDATGEWTHWDI